MAERFLGLLERFNRKERFFLIGWTLGNREFRLSDEFRGPVSSVTGLDVPSDAFAAMDYHLDWICACAFLATRGEEGPVYDNSDGAIQATQEDIDLLVAFEADGICNVVLVEAKGVTGWTNKQMESKAGRLTEIFGQTGARWPNIRPRLILASPREPQKLDCTRWPMWMKHGNNSPYWMKMAVPDDRMSVTRCEEGGRVSEHGRHWKIQHRRKSGTRDLP